MDGLRWILRNRAGGMRKWKMSFSGMELMILAHELNYDLGSINKDTLSSTVMYCQTMEREREQLLLY